jgi:hypothetical protein
MGARFRQLKILTNDPVTSALDQQIDRLFEAINLIGIGPAPALNTSQKAQNLDAILVCYTSNGTGLDQTLNHGLGRVPVGMLNIPVPLTAGESPQPGEVYFGKTTPTSSQVTVRCVALNVRRVFLLF